MASVKIIVDDRLRVEAKLLSSTALEELREAFTHKNPQHGRLAAINRQWAKSEPKEYRTWKGAPGFITLPRGGTARLREVLTRHGLAPCWDDQRVFRNAVQPRHLRTLRPYQERLVRAALERENCLLRAYTAAGKTTVANALASRLGTPTLIIVQSGALFEQWRERAEQEFGLREKDVGVIRAGKIKLKPITVAMQQTLHKLDAGEREQVRAYFGAVVCDEVHLFGARTFSETIDWMPARYRVGVSSDERRKDRKEFLIHDQFGDVACEVDREELEGLGFVAGVEARIIPTTVSAGWYRESKNFTALLEQLEGEDERNVLAANIAVAEARAGHQVLIFSHRREHCRRLAQLVGEQGITAGVLIGGKGDEQELARAVEGIRKGRIAVGVGTIQAIGTGLDLPTISRGVLATPIATNKQLFGQVRGRLCRAVVGKDKAILYYLHDGSAFGTLPVRNVSRWCSRTEVREGSAWMPADAWLKQHRDEDPDSIEQLLGLGEGHEQLTLEAL